MSRRRAEYQRAELVAGLLAGTWREAPPAPALSADELASVVPLLLEAGGGALAWRKVRGSALSDAAAARKLRQAYRLHALQTALHESNLVAALGLLRAAGVEPLLVKGWAAARLYHEPNTRVYGDLDLCVRPADYAATRRALAEAGDRLPVDLHRGLEALDDRGRDELFDRSRLLPLGHTHVRVLSDEDHLRVLCFHLLRHGVARPPGLCDIAAAVESLPSGFDWKTCLGEDEKRARWVSCTIGLAVRLLGARPVSMPLAVGAERLPGWLLDATLREWGRPFSAHFARQDSFAFQLRRPAGLLRAAALRWPSPIVGTVSVGGAFNSLPRLPYQLAYLFARTRRFIRRGLAPV